MSESGEGLPKLEALPRVAEENGNRVYDSNDPLVQQWLREHWTFGYNPLAVAKTKDSTAIRLHLPDGNTYDYQEPSHAYELYRKNRNDDLPNYLVHATQGGWIEIALRENGGFIGKENEIYTSSHDPHRWWGGNFPKGYDFQQPEGRFAELMFDASILRQEGFIPRHSPQSDYFIFNRRLPLKALIPTSKAYISQVMKLDVT